MTKPPPEDPRITDLNRYRKQRDRAKKVRPNPKAQMRETVLGTNPRAGLILAAAIAAFLLLFVAPIIAANFF